MINSSSKVNTLKYDLLMVLITAIWGTSFVVVKELVRNLSALTYLSARFSIATLVLFIYLLKSWKKIDYEAIKGG
ncbi:MAG: EamA family transporter, partial [Blastocatellia bacterium]|nr:EamA family transporter [Blastocatellia bacterium]